MNPRENDSGRFESIEDVEQLEELLSRPTSAVVDWMGRLEGDLIVLGVGGKIGPTLARMARRASEQAGVSRRVIGVDKVVPPDLHEKFQAQGIEAIACDLLDRKLLAARPDVPNVIYMAAMKFGATGQEALTWAMNTYLPGLVCERFRHSRFVVYSTGNVYPLSPVDGGGSKEDDPTGPIGDYAMSCLGRERIFTHFSLALDIPVALIRLNYANELRYGVLTDVAQKVLAGEQVDLTMGYANVIWQGDANAMVLRAFEHAAVPARPINLVGPDTLGLREVAEEFGRRFGKPVQFAGSEAPDALLSNGRLGHELLGAPSVTPEQMIDWVADWQLRGGVTLGKPTKFQVRNGKF